MRRGAEHGRVRAWKSAGRQCIAAESVHTARERAPGQRGKEHRRSAGRALAQGGESAGIGWRIEPAQGGG